MTHVSVISTLPNKAIIRCLLTCYSIHVDQLINEPLRSIQRRICSAEKRDRLLLVLVAQNNDCKCNAAQSYIELSAPGAECLANIKPPIIFQLFYVIILRNQYGATSDSEFQIRRYHPVRLLSLEKHL